MPATITVLYPNTDDVTFDFDYYNSTHDALVRKDLSKGLQDFIVIKCAGVAPDMAKPPYVVEARFVYESMEALQAALAGAGDVLADIPNFTNVQPTVIIGETMAPI